MKKRYKLRIDNEHIADESTFKKIFQIAKEKLLTGNGKEAHITGPYMCDCLFYLATKG